jgi:prefoldin subunit 5
MQKDEMSKEISEQLSTLKEQAEHLNKFCQSIQLMLRNGDVAFTTVEEAKQLLAELKPSELKLALDKTFKTLKARAIARVKEI